MAPGVATALARLATRDHWTGHDDLVFPGVAGGYLDGSALSRRYKAALERAALRPLRFHDLRHTFGTRMIAKADILKRPGVDGPRPDSPRPKRDLHYVERPEEVALVADAFAIEPRVTAAA